VGEGLEALIVRVEVITAAVRRIAAVVQEVGVVDADVLDGRRIDVVDEPLE
jgi:hypothetical protein